MAKWKKGDVVVHKSTNDKLYILMVREGEELLGKDNIPTSYLVRLPDYRTVTLSELELAPLRASTKIQD